MNISHANAKRTIPGPVHLLDSSRPVAERNEEATLAHESRLLNEALTVALNSPDVRQDRIDALRARIADGTYEIDARSIAESLLRENPALFDEISD